MTTLALAALALLGRRGPEADSGPPPGSRRLWFILGAFFLVALPFWLVSARHQTRTA